jgi:hypothetical protein
VWTLAQLSAEQAVRGAPVTFDVGSLPWALHPFGAPLLQKLCACLALADHQSSGAFVLQGMRGSPMTFGHRMPVLVKHPLETVISGRPS